jgi:hypothetical protein
MLVKCGHVFQFARPISAVSLAHRSEASRHPDGFTNSWRAILNVVASLLQVSARPSPLSTSTGSRLRTGRVGYRFAPWGDPIRAPTTRSRDEC